MWTCPCGSQNDEDALACVSCGRERDILESSHEMPSSAFKEIEEAQRELEGPAAPRPSVKQEIKQETPLMPAAPPPPPQKEAEKITESVEELRLDTEEPGQSVIEELEDLGRELGEVPLVTPREEEEGEAPYEELIYEEEREGSAVKKVLRIVDVTVVCIVLVIVAVIAIVQIGGIRESGFSAYLSKCLGIWIRSIIVTQVVLVIGGIIYFLLREPGIRKPR